jgi:Fic family protein
MDLLTNLTLTPALLRLVASVDEFKGRWRALERLAPERLSALRHVATIESVGSSTRIEGAKLSDPEIDALLAGIDVRSFRSRDEEEVAGYAAAMELVFESWRELELTENHLRQLHGLLLRHSSKDERHRGEYKTLPNHLEAFAPDGTSLGVVFETTSPFDTPREMAALVTWTREALGAALHHPLLVIGAFTVRFLAIHPFQDGNGRLSRILTTLLLLRSGYAYVPYGSLERVVEENKDEYYRALRRGQQQPDPGGGGMAEWLLFFLRCLSQQATALERKVEREQAMAALPELDERLLRLAREHGRLTLAAAAKLTRANRNTLKVAFRRLVVSGRLRLHGAGRGAWYEAT